jgi:hypothetical protein
MWGNHDIERKNPKIVKKPLYRYVDQRTGKYEPLFDGINVHEELLLRHTDTQKKIFLVHGHQGGIMVETLWRLDRFLQRYFWKRLQLFGLKTPPCLQKTIKQKLSIISAAGRIPLG